MSTIVEQLTEAQAAIAALTTERDTFRAAAESAATLAENLKAEKAKLEGDCAALKEGILAEAKSGREKFQVSEAALTKANEEKAEAAAELAKLKAAVASNPAFADAASKGAKPVADVGKDAVKSMPHSEYRKLSPREQADLARSGVTLTSD